MNRLLYSECENGIASFKAGFNRKAINHRSERIIDAIDGQQPNACCAPAGLRRGN